VPGTGLGLAIVDALAGRWGARATLAPRPDGGTRAELRFPATGAPAPEPADDSAPTTTVTP
jgi:signal transduction histidine kinase